MNRNKNPILHFRIRWIHPEKPGLWMYKLLIIGTEILIPIWPEDQPSSDFGLVQQNIASCISPNYHQSNCPNRCSNNWKSGALCWSSTSLFRMPRSWRSICWPMSAASTSNWRWWRTTIAEWRWTCWTSRWSHVQWFWPQTWRDAESTWRQES